MTDNKQQPNHETLLLKSDKDRRTKFKNGDLTLTMNDNKTIDVTKITVKLYIDYTIDSDDYCDEGTGTGNIIITNHDKVYVLTCAHNVTKLKNHKWRDAVSVSFIYNGTKFEKINVYIHDEYRNNINENINENDLAIIVFKDVGSVFNKSMTLLPYIVTDDIYNNIETCTGYILGYPGEFNDNILRGMKGNIKSKSNEQRLEYEIDTTKGQSGSLIFGLINNDDNIYGIIGIHTHGAQLNPKGKYNFGIKINAIKLSWIKNTIFDDFFNESNNIIAYESKMDDSLPNMGNEHLRLNTNESMMTDMTDFIGPFKDWLRHTAHSWEYYNSFILKGYDDMYTIVELNDDILLTEIGIKKEGHRRRILKAIKQYKEAHNDYDEKASMVNPLSAINESEPVFQSKIILNANAWNKFVSKISKELNKNIKLTKIFDSSNDGFDNETFHNKCDNKGPTLCIIKNDFNYIFGGYTKVSWTTNEGYKWDDTAFLFGIKPKMFISNIQGNHHKYAVCHYKIKCSISFGEFGDIQLQNNNNTNIHCFSKIYSFKYKSNLVCNNQNYNERKKSKVINYEMYTVSNV